MTKGKSLYLGVLNEPMDFQIARTSLLFGKPTTAMKCEYTEENIKSFFSRVMALFEHYELDIGEEGAPMSLALALAQDHVPGFQIKDKKKRGRGRPGKWTGFKRLELYADVKCLSSRGHSDLNACKILAENVKYAARYGNQTKGNLHRRYIEGVTNIDPAIRKAFDVLGVDIEADAFVEICISAFALSEK